MSSFENTNTQAFQEQPAPQHHQHASSDLLPGARSNKKAPTTGADYSSGVLDDVGTWEQGPISQGRGNDEFEHKNTAFNSDRPMNAQPSGAGGVAIDGREDLPEGHATATDKLVGKMQKVSGKYLNKPALHEKGELRETGGKAAATGNARAAHD